MTSPSRSVSRSGGSSRSIEHLLEGPPEEAQRGDSPSAATLRGLIEDPGEAERVPSTGWRLLEQERDRATFAAYDPERWQGWVVATFEHREGEWRCKSSSYGMQVLPTRRQRGHRLRLAWTEHEFACRSDEHPQLLLRLINARVRSTGWTTVASTGASPHSWILRSCLWQCGPLLTGSLVRRSRPNVRSSSRRIRDATRSASG